MIEIPTGDAIRAALQEQLRELLTAESLGADVAKEIDAVVWLLQLPFRELETEPGPGSWLN
jgi:hypothetical protein